MVIAGVLTVLISFSALVGAYGKLAESVDASDKVKILLDAGHGGVDGGVSGVKTKVKESDLNLLVVKELKRQAEEVGLSVVLTRSTDAGLYGSATKDRKKKEMERRKKIIEAENPTLVVSVHMNAYPVSTRRGAQVFFKKGDERAVRLADILQQRLNGLETNEKPYNPLSGDYYILNCSKIPSCIVECGFLSNEKDEALLSSPAFRKKLCSALLGGICEYLNA